MNVRELMDKLSRLDPELPGVMQQTDEPLGDYEVLDVSVVSAEPDKLFHRTAPSRGGRTWDSPQAWNTYDGEAFEVVLLGSDKPWQPTIDSELAPAQLSQGCDTP